MSQRFELLKSIYLDATTTIPHYDGQRATFTQLILSAITVLFGIVVVSGDAASPVVVVRALALMGAAMSIAGLLVSKKLNDLISYHRLRARIALRELDAVLGDAPISDIDKENAAHRSRNRLGRIRLRAVWSFVFIIYFVAYVVLCVAPDIVTS